MLFHGTLSLTPLLSSVIKRTYEVIAIYINVVYLLTIFDS